MVGVSFPNPFWKEVRHNLKTVGEEPYRVDATGRDRGRGGRGQGRGQGRGGRGGSERHARDPQYVVTILPHLGSPDFPLLFLTCAFHTTAKYPRSNPRLLPRKSRKHEAENRVEAELRSSPSSLCINQSNNQDNSTPYFCPTFLVLCSPFERFDRETWEILKDGTLKEGGGLFGSRFGKKDEMMSVVSGIRFRPQILEIELLAIIPKWPFDVVSSMSSESYVAEKTAKT